MPLFREPRKLYVDGSSHSSAQIGGTRRDVAEMLIVCKLHFPLYFGSTTRESLKDTIDISTGLHRNNAELILLVDPD